MARLDKTLFQFDNTCTELDSHFYTTYWHQTRLNLLATTLYSSTFNGWRACNFVSGSFFVDVGRSLWYFPTLLINGLFFMTCEMVYLICANLGLNWSACAERKIKIWFRKWRQNLFAVTNELYAEVGVVCVLCQTDK